MAGKKENLKALFTNTRTRLIIVFTIIVMLFAVIFGLIKFLKLSSPGGGTSSVATTPSIESIPGALNQTEEYSKLQQTQNLNQADAALQQGNSAIPTLVNAQAAGSGVRAIGSQTGQGGAGFSSLAREDEAGAQKSAWLLELQNSDCSNDTIKKVLDEGADLSIIKQACTCIQLKDTGISLLKLEKVCACKELRAAGVSARQLKDAGFSAGRLRDCGFNACELKNAGFTAQEMKDAGFSDGELKGAGFTDDEISRASGLPDGVSEADVRKAGCSQAALANLRAKGVTASAIRRISGCGVEQLKAAGFSAKDLMKAGFTAAELRKAEFSPNELRNAGFSARELLDAGFTPEDLAKAGFTDAEITAAENELPSGITADDIKKGGCDPEAIKNARLAGVSAKAIKQYAGCSADALKAGGYTDEDLARADFTKDQIAGAGVALDTQIKVAGCDPEKVKALKQKGVTADKIQQLNGCRVEQMKAAGYDVKELLAAGYSPEELARAGFSPESVRSAQEALDAMIKAAGCDPEKLKALLAQGVAAKKIRTINNCTADQLKAAGYSRDVLLASGLSPEEVDKAFTDKPSLLAAARRGDCSVASLKTARAAGISADTIRKTLGCSADAMKAAVFTAEELKAAGFTAAELKAAGFSPKELRAAGFTAKEFKDAGFSAKDLKDAGFSPKELKDAGFTAKDLKDAGFSPADLKNAGFSATELKAAGFSPKDVKAAGFSPEELRAANVPVDVSAATETAIQGGASSGSLGAMPAIPGQAPDALAIANLAAAKQLEDMAVRQKRQYIDQKYQQQIQQRTSDMLGSANAALSIWRQSPVQQYVAGTAQEEKEGSAIVAAEVGEKGQVAGVEAEALGGMRNRALVRTGDVIFAVIDTSVNSDEPSPILATVVSGKFKGARLIGSFNLPNKAKKMIITFNLMSVPGADKTTPISAVAIDTATARTGLSSKTNRHLLFRYGSLFASSFLEGFGNAFQSANTTVTIGGTSAGPGTVQVSNGVGRSALENAVIGLATLGQNWSQVAQQAFSRPTTVEVYSGTGVGVLFTQDVFSL